MCVLTVIPALPVNEPCQYCEPQECYNASLWWGDLLMVFYSKDPERLTPERLNATACEILQELSAALKPDSADVIGCEEIIKAIGNTIFPVYWADFRPPVLMAYSSSCCVKETEGEAVSP